LWGMDSFNIIKGIAIVLIFGGVYLVTLSRSRKDMEESAVALPSEER